MSDRWKSVRDNYKEWHMSNAKNLEITRNMYASLISSLLSDRDEFENPTIESRIKDKDECLQKFERKYKKDYSDEELNKEKIIERVTDLIGIRIICLYEDDLEKIEKILKTNFVIKSKTNKTRALKEDQFGYKGLHLDVELTEERKMLGEYSRITSYPVEIQIRTIIQDAWSVLDHKIKYKHELEPDLKRAINRLAAIFDLADSEFQRIRDKTKLMVLEASEAIASIDMPKESSSAMQMGTSGTYMSCLLFTQFMLAKYPNYSFMQYKIDSFYNEISQKGFELSLEEMKVIFDQYSGLIDQYESESKNIYDMNPYTKLRHMLYLYDKVKFGYLLMEYQASNFENWEQREIKENTSEDTSS